MDILKKISQVFFAENKQANLLRKIAIMGMVGILLLLIGSSLTRNNTIDNTPNYSTKTTDSAPPKEENYTSALANDLEELISMIEGVGRVQVKLYISRGNIYQYEYNEKNTNKITTETDQNSGTREIQDQTIDKELVIIQDVNGNEKPVIRVEKKPKINGVLIVAQGAERSEIKYLITEAVSNFLNLPLYKINVLPGRGGN
jgi:stage III sporulation protein AG